MTKEIAYTDKYALILSDEIPTKVYYDTYIHQLKHTGDAEYGESSIAKTVIGHLPLSDAPILEGVPLLPPLPPESNLLKLLDLLGEITSDNPPPIEEVKRKRDEAKQQRPTHFECEEEIYYFAENGADLSRPKTTTNSQGQLEFVGKYLTKN